MSRPRDKGAISLAVWYALVGIAVALLAPAALSVYPLMSDRPQVPDPVRLFLLLAPGGAAIFATAGWFLGRRHHALIARNRELATRSALFEELSMNDALTGLPNRRAFDDRLAIELARGARYGVPCALVMIDLDHFKHVNDRFGHPAGDEVLRRIASRLQAEKRAGDLVARYGGEEFAAILAHADAGAAAAWAERARAAVAAQRVPWGQAQISLTASFGVAAAPAHGPDAPALIEAADAALYEAKRLGGDHVVIERTQGGATARSA
jgi:diguanylate cyclase (GGDEF)-like protein